MSHFAHRRNTAKRGISHCGCASIVERLRDKKGLLRISLTGSFLSHKKMGCILKAIPDTSHFGSTDANSHLINFLSFPCFFSFPRSIDLRYIFLSREVIASITTGEKIISINTKIIMPNSRALKFKSFCKIKAQPKNISGD